MSIKTSSLEHAVRLIRQRMPEIELELNHADGMLGDGDTGVMLRRVFDAMAAVSEDELDGVGSGLRAFAMKCATATGSSLGTLIATGMLAAAKEGGDKKDIEWRELGQLLFATRQAMMKRGKSKLGDKTVLDTLEAVAQAVEGVENMHGVSSSALNAARASLAEYRDRPCRVGRARIYAEKSVGIDDPGMLALTRIIETLCGEMSTNHASFRSAQL